jgi:hypothetical protein
MFRLSKSKIYQKYSKIKITGTYFIMSQLKDKIWFTVRPQQVEGFLAGRLSENVPNAAPVAQPLVQGRQDAHPAMENV